MPVSPRSPLGRPVIRYARPEAATGVPRSAPWQETAAPSARPRATCCRAAHAPSRWQGPTGSTTTVPPGAFVSYPSSAPGFHTVLHSAAARSIVREAWLVRNACWPPRSHRSSPSRFATRRIEVVRPLPRSRAATLWDPSRGAAWASSATWFRPIPATTTAPSVTTPLAPAAAARSATLRANACQDGPVTERPRALSGSAGRPAIPGRRILAGSAAAPAATTATSTASVPRDGDAGPPARLASARGPLPHVPGHGPALE